MYKPDVDVRELTKYCNTGYTKSMCTSDNNDDTEMTLEA